ncbi:MAG: LacI family DNA-binding transcriptional regulator [Variovorax sp.]|nr:MAG: LacI family DNA-binding transcriptional regulator [Variovorax sp.]
MKKEAVDIRDVAALAGVSVGSASRVINGVANVSDGTRQKVERAIAALNYRPNHAAQSLRSRSSKTIGCLFTDVTNPLYARLFQALEARLRADGYMLLLANGLNDSEREVETLLMFGRRGMDGVIAAPGNERAPGVIAALNALAMPVVLLDRDMSAAGCDALLFDHARGMKAAMAHLFELGHRRIALALWRATSRPVRRRIEGYRAAYRAAGLTPPDDLLVQAASATGSVYDDVHALLQRADRPTAILAQGTYTLGSTLQAIADHGLRVPQDISVVTIGDSDAARNHRPPISLLNVDSMRVAELIAGLLRSRMDAPGQEARSEKVPLTFQDRGSVGAPPALRKPLSNQ